MPDKEITCVECHQPFLYTEQMQQKLQELAESGKIDRVNEPKRCAPCRAARKPKFQGNRR